MAHFAKIDENNIVTDVIVVANAVLLNEDGTESEQKGIDFLTGLFGVGNWKQTSFNEVFRANFASIGGVYDAENDVFISAKTYESFVLNDNFKWIAPVAYPNDGKIYVWNEKDVKWDSTQPYPSWEWDEELLMWIPPVPYPNGEYTPDYEWNEENQTWDSV